MKTNRSFLALPLVGLAMVLVFALAACGGGSTTGPSDPSSSSAGGYIPPTPTPEADSININNFNLSEPQDGIITMSGFVKAKGEGTMVVRLEFRTQGSGWVSFDGAPRTGAFDIDPIKQVNLNKAQIDLNNTAIQCGDYTVTVIGCTDKACKNFATDTRNFSKPEEYCRSSSSETVVSSSSAMGWRFGSGQELNVNKSEPTPIGPSGSTFTLRETEEGVGIGFTSCTIRDTDQANKIGPDSEPLNGKADDYPADIFGVAPAFGIGPAVSTLELVSKVYYIVTCGSDKFLMWFRITDRGLEITPDTWPKQVKYWPITQSPEGLL